MPTTSKQENDFLSSVIDSNLLEASIDWIKNNMSIQDVFGEKALLDEAKNYDAEEVCNQSALESWAESNGYTKE